MYFFNMKTLHIYIRGEHYQVDEHGCIYGGPNNVEVGCKSGHEWLFLGVSTHHLQNRIIHDPKAIQENPSLAVKGYLWDRDHGTVRQWGGSYNGHLPRVTSAYIE